MSDLLNPTLGNAPYDVLRVRQDFPILTRLVHEKKGRAGKPLVYLDNGASAQKPRAVIDAMRHLLENDDANVHRGVHFLAQRSTDLYEATRDKVARFLNAPSRENIVFTRNATEAFNLLANSWGGRFLKAGDAVIISWMEHHANIVPWQLLRDRIGITIKVVPVLDDGSLDMAAYEAMLTPEVKLVFVDLHAEATSDKQALGRYVDGRVTAVLGTHTHVPTADECILPGGTAFQSDVGMTGPHESILGRRIDRVLETMRTFRPTHFEVATGDVRINGAIVEADPQTGRATSIRRIVVDQKSADRLAALARCDRS